VGTAALGCPAAQVIGPQQTPLPPHFHLQPEPFHRGMSFRRTSEARQEESAVSRERIGRGCPILAAFPEAEIYPALKRQDGDFDFLSRARDPLSFRRASAARQESPPGLAEAPSEAEEKAEGNPL
jgi:hypothetical protein